MKIDQKIEEGSKKKKRITWAHYWKQWRVLMMGALVSKNQDYKLLFPNHNRPHFLVQAMSWLSYCLGIPKWKIQPNSRVLLVKRGKLNKIFPYKLVLFLGFCFIKKKIVIMLKVLFGSKIQMKFGFLLIKLFFFSIYVVFFFFVSYIVEFI